MEGNFKKKMAEEIDFEKLLENPLVDFKNLLTNHRAWIILRYLILPWGRCRCQQSILNYANFSRQERTYFSAENVQSGIGFITKTLEEEGSTIKLNFDSLSTSDAASFVNVLYSFILQKQVFPKPEVKVSTERQSSERRN